MDDPDIEQLQEIRLALLAAGIPAKRATLGSTGRVSYVAVRSRFGWVSLRLLVDSVCGGVGVIIAEMYLPRGVMRITQINGLPMSDAAAFAAERICLPAILGGWLAAKLTARRRTHSAAGTRQAPGCFDFGNTLP
jgi:hypothetical protein